MKISRNQHSQEQTYNASDFCSTKEAARILGVSHRTIQLWVESGVLQAWKTAGGHRRITMQSVQQLVDQRHQAIQPPLVVAGGVTARKKILLVDDDPTMLRLYEVGISNWKMPFEVIKASNGFEALIKIGETKPDLLISDLSMPGMDGFRMIRTLRSDAAYSMMSIIVVSGLGSETIKSMDLPDDIPVFMKPVPFPDLYAAVERALRREA